jgi:hypothetical protein
LASFGVKVTWCFSKKHVLKCEKMIQHFKGELQFSLCQKSEADTESEVSGSTV